MLKHLWYVSRLGGLIILILTPIITYTNGLSLSKKADDVVFPHVMLFIIIE